MADLTSRHRVQPALLDRLTDDDPSAHTESTDHREFSLARLRDSVRRDLGYLLNATQLASVVDLGAYPEVERSTVNFGIPDLAGHPASTVDRPAIVRLIRQAILQFEPRLLKQSLKVQMAPSADAPEPNALRFDIDAELWAQPLPIRLRLRMDLSLEDGEAEITELSSEG
ncbi:MAG: type VI secretion system baseplate subunit TssE [Polyangiaceae bacterium]|nr:type VI secretion system baseplate subunit TssE [Polyangiaceae bacterium]